MRQDGDMPGAQARMHFKVIAFQLASMSHRQALAECDFLRLQYYGCCSKSLPFRAIAPRAAAASDCSLEENIMNRSVQQVTYTGDKGQSHRLVYCIKYSTLAHSSNLKA